MHVWTTLRLKSSLRINRKGNKYIIYSTIKPDHRKHSANLYPMTSITLNFGATPLQTTFAIMRDLFVFGIGKVKKCHADSLFWVTQYFKLSNAKRRRSYWANTISQIYLPIPRVPSACNITLFVFFVFVFVFFKPSLVMIVFKPARLFSVV